MPKENYWVVIPAAGIGSRMGSEVPKQYLDLCGKPVLQHTVECFINHPRINAVMVVLSADDNFWSSTEVAVMEKIMTAEGGKERCHSVLNGLRALSAHAHANDWVLVHDAARPCLSMDELDRLLETLDGHAVGGILAVPVRDTMKRADVGNEITETVERKNLWHAMTPQMFRYQNLLEALSAALEDGKIVTDEAQAIEMTGVKPLLIEGRFSNIKITQMSDLSLAGMYLQRQEKS